VNRDIFIEKQKEIMKQPDWIIDGNYTSTMDLRIKYADIVIFLYYKTLRCLYRIIKRRIQYHGQTRPDMGDNCKEKLDWEFVHYVLQFNKNRAPAILTKLESLNDKQIFIIKHPKQLKELIHNLNDVSID
ncbi:AAA family ATPase, partial [Paludifilum halophilum]